MTAPPPRRTDSTDRATEDIHRLLRHFETSGLPAERVLVAAQRRLILARAPELHRLRELLRIEDDMRTTMPTIDADVVRLITACRDLDFEVIALFARRRPAELRKRLMTALGA